MRLTQWTLLCHFRPLSGFYSDEMARNSSHVSASYQTACCSHIAYCLCFVQRVAVQQPCLAFLLRILKVPVRRRAILTESFRRLSQSFKANDGVYLDEGRSCFLQVFFPIHHSLSSCHATFDADGCLIYN